MSLPNDKRINDEIQKRIDYSLNYDINTKKITWYEKKYGPYIEKPGLHNLKNLFRKPTLYEWVILGMIILSLFMYWAYSHDVSSSFQNGYNSCLNNLTKIAFPK